MTDQPFDRDAPQRAFQLGERDDDAAPRLIGAVDSDADEHLEYRLARLEIFERYGHIALRSRGGHSHVRSATEPECCDFEIVPTLASDRWPIRRDPPQRTKGAHPDASDERRPGVGHPASWTAVVAANVPLAPSPVTERLELGPEFPTIRIVESELAPDVDDRTWFSRSFDFWTFDRSIDERAGFRFHLTIRTADPDRTLPQILTRCQRLFDRRNAASACSVFDRILKAHHDIHDLAQPLVRAEYDHALDVWQWVLRLDTDATFETQVAALFHDVDRLLNQQSSSAELMRNDYIRLKQDHAEAGAWIAEQLLGAIGLPPAASERICSLVAAHETPGDDSAAAIVNEADALSFFSFNSPGFFDYFDPAHCRAKVDEMIARLGPRGKSLLPTIFLRPDVAAMVRDAGALH